MPTGRAPSASASAEIALDAAVRAPGFAGPEHLPGGRSFAQDAAPSLRSRTPICRCARLAYREDGLTVGWSCSGQFLAAGREANAWTIWQKDDPCIRGVGLLPVAGRDRCRWLPGRRPWLADVQPEIVGVAALLLCAPELCGGRALTGYLGGDFVHVRGGRDDLSCLEVPAGAHRDEGSLDLLDRDGTALRQDGHRFEEIAGPLRVAGRDSCRLLGGWPGWLADGQVQASLLWVLALLFCAPELDGKASPGEREDALTLRP
jgi:hypothetical protein